MFSGWRTMGLAVAGAFAVAAGGPAVAVAKRTHHRPSLPDLTIKSGSLTAANGRISGSFFVKNAGRRRAAKSQAVVRVAAGANPIIQVYAVRSLKAGGTEEEAVSELVPTGLPTGSFAIRACADYKHTVRERSRSNDCRRV